MVLRRFCSAPLQLRRRRHCGSTPHRSLVCQFRGDCHEPAHAQSSPISHHPFPGADHRCTAAIPGREIPRAVIAALKTHFVCRIPSERRRHRSQTRPFATVTERSVMNRTPPITPEPDMLTAAAVLTRRRKEIAACGSGLFLDGAGHGERLKNAARLPSPFETVVTPHVTALRGRGKTFQARSCQPVVGILRNCVPGRCGHLGFEEPGSRRSSLLDDQSAFQWWAVGNEHMKSGEMQQRSQRASEYPRTRWLAPATAAIRPPATPDVAESGPNRWMRLIESRRSVDDPEAATPWWAGRAHAANP